MDKDNERLIGFLIGLVVLITLLWLVFLAVVVTLASVALFIIGWGLTYSLIKGVDTAFDSQFSTEYAGILLIASGGFWAFVAWLFIPDQWLHWLVSQFPSLGNVTYLSPIVGATLGLAWSVLVLFTSDSEEDVSLLNASGMYAFTEQQLLDMDPDTSDLVSQGIILGTDVDA